MILITYPLSGVAPLALGDPEPPLVLLPSVNARALHFLVFQSINSLTFSSDLLVDELIADLTGLTSC